MGEMDHALGTAEAVARRGYGKLIALLAARTRDVAAAEDALSDAFAAALKDWPIKGIPSNPEAWLITVAKRKIIDAKRRQAVGDSAEGELKRLAEELSAKTADEDFPDQRLALMFACAHPAIDAGVRAPLILRTVLGLDAARIASAFLISPAAMGQRLARAKAKIREAGIPFMVPDTKDLPERLEAVLDAIYAAFAEGWSDPVGADAQRRELAEEAVYLGGLVCDMLDEPEALGLLALMLFADARRTARRGPNGEFVPLDEQDMALWDSASIARAEALLRRAGARSSLGRYQLEAALQSAHVARKREGVANWPDVVQLYDALFALSDSPVVAINRAVAIAEMSGAQAGLEALKAMASDARLQSYQPYWAAHASLLAKSGSHKEARQAYEIAIGLERDPAVRRFLTERQSSLAR
jgi:RNA polymerase sigma-70 factor (ECF subfamily)